MYKTSCLGNYKWLALAIQIGNAAGIFVLPKESSLNNFICFCYVDVC